MEVFVGGQVGDLDVEDVVVVADDVMGLPDFGECNDGTFKRDDVGAGVPDEADADEDSQASTDHVGIDDCAVAADSADSFEPADSPEAG